MMDNKVCNQLNGICVNSSDFYLQQFMLFIQIHRYEVVVHCYLNEMYALINFWFNKQIIWVCLKF